MEKIQSKQIVESETIGVLLINLGTPDAASYVAVQRYLREFLSDPRVIEVPRLLWKIILYGFILPLRPFIIAKKYARIWLDEGAPLLVYTQQLTKALQHQFKGTNTIVTLGMRYGNPSIKTALSELKTKAIRKLIILPLYPQYSAATTASTFDIISRELQHWRFIPEINFINGYAEHMTYINALAETVTDYWKTHIRGEKLLISFHGLPQRNTEKGDPYYYFCCQTAQLIAKQLKLSSEQWQIVFQSRFGKATWLQPYCAEILTQLAQTGTKSVDVICPGFPVDCLETLEEIADTYADLFKNAGGERLNYIPALNASTANVKLLQQLIEERL